MGRTVCQVREQHMWMPGGRKESSDFKEPIEAKWGCDLLNEFAK